MPVAPRQLWMALEYHLAPELHLVGVRTSLGGQAENRGEKRGSVAMPTEAFIAAGSSASLGIIFCCWFRFLWSASQALAVRQILSSVAMV